jgi:hypothetical protein
MSARSGAPAAVPTKTTRLWMRALFAAAPSSVITLRRRQKTMCNRKSALAILGVLLAAGTVSMNAGTVARTSHVTFGGPVALPGVTLGSGTYIFELADPLSNIEVVTVRDKKHVYYMGFTELVPRPRGSVKIVTLEEAQAGLAPRINAWFPEGDGAGHRFIYRH